MRILRFISDKCVHFLLEERVIDESRVELYQYGFELLAASVMDAAWILILGFWLDDFFTALVYVLILSTVRTQIGGFHASTYFRCFLCYTVFWGVVVLLTRLCAAMRITLTGLIVLSCMVLFVIYLKAPVPHNKKLDEEEKAEARKKGLVRTVVWLGIMFGASSYGLKYAYSIISVLVLSVALMIVEWILQKQANGGQV